MGFTVCCELSDDTIAHFRVTDGGRDVGSLPRYSSDVGEAWSLLERFPHLGFQLQRRPREEYWAVFEHDGKSVGVGNDHSVAMAICRAALEVSDTNFAR